MFQADLRARLQQWGAEQCVGDVFLKLCSKLRVYTNYLHSYATAVRSIDKVINSSSETQRLVCSLRRSPICNQMMLCVSVQGDKTSVSGFPEQIRQNSGDTHAEVTAHTHLMDR